MQEDSVKTDRISSIDIWMRIPYNHTGAKKQIEKEVNDGKQTRVYE